MRKDLIPMKKFMKKLAKKAEGFTLVELIVVIAILGILAAIAVPAYSGYLESAKEAADIVELDSIKTAAQAALATKGSVDGLTVSETNSKVVASLDDTSNSSVTLYDASASPKSYGDFLLYATGSDTGTFKVTLDTGSSASWPNTDGGWDIN